MNKKILTLLSVPLFLLASCNGAAYDVTAVREEAMAAVQALNVPSDPSLVVVSATGSGHVGRFDSDPTVSKLDGAVRQTTENTTTDADGNETTTTTTTYVTSIFLRFPVLLREEVFLTDIRNDAGSIVENNQFGVLYDRMSSSIDTRGRMQFETTEDGGVHFYCRSVSKKDIALYNVNSSGRMEVSGRFNIDAYYDASGLLTLERFELEAKVTSEKEKTIELVANYTYTLQ